MTRVDGRRPEPQKIEFISDWSKLKDSVGVLRKILHTCKDQERITLNADVAEDVVHFVPALLDAYAELWELTANLMQAVEAQKASQNTLYVPDAQELISGLANPERTRR